jgi:two-component system phosphate regulon sensor histidine kinase PhoR
MKKPWNNRLIYKFFLSYLAIIVLLSAGFFLYTSNLLRDFYVTSIGKVMEQKARVLAQLLPWAKEPGTLDALCRSLAEELGVRITIIAQDGRVIGDSDKPAIELENHSTRPEVSAAFAQGTGIAVRYSTSVKHELLYHAFRQTKGTSERIVRVAVPLTEIHNVTQSFGRALLGGVLLSALLGLAVAFMFSRRLSKRVNRIVDFSRAVAQGDFSNRILPRSDSDELDLLEQNLQEMSVKIRDNINEIRSEKEKADSILRCMIEGLIVIDPKGTVLLANDRAKQIFNVRDDQIPGASFVEISRSPELRQVLQEIAAFDFTRDHYSKRISLDDTRWFRINAVNLQNGSDRPKGSILVFHEITEIQRLETVRSDFVANVSHELRTPLTAIRGYVETLLQNPPTDAKDAHQFLTIIERHAERLSRLTEDLLILADLESGALRIARKAVEPGYIIQRVLEIFWDQAAKKNIQLSHHMAPNLPPVFGDPDRLQQLFINLVDNALKYTPAGGSVTITGAHVVTSPESPARVEIAVIDTGAGIPEKDIPRLTERFYRVDKARSRELGGTGLGLAIVKHIVQAHGGELKIESILQKGTTVRVFLPLAAAETQQHASLFLCTGNSCRSQMAEGFARQLARDGQRVFSAGIAPKGIHPLAVQVMKEVGIDITTQQSKGLESVPLAEIDRVITLCGDAAENCPVLPMKVQRIHWPLLDPASAEGSPEVILQIFRNVRDEIRGRVEQLFNTGSVLAHVADPGGESRLPRSHR